jgi:hypothetical protein
VQRLFTVLLAIVLLAALTASQVAAQEPSPAPSSDPAPAASLSPEASALAAEARSIVAEVFAQTAEAPEEAAAAARAAEIERTGLAEIDPELPAILAELEAQAADEFATFLAEAPGLPAEASASEPSADASPEPGTEASPAPSPEAGPSAFLAAVAPGPHHDDLRFAQGGSYVSSIGQVLGYASRLVGGFQPSKGSGRGTAEPLRSGGGSYRIGVAFDRDTLTLIIEATERYSVPGGSPDSPPFEVTDTGGTTLQVDTCPDEDGTIVVTANASGTYDVTGEGLSYHASLDTNDHATVTVNDEADIAGRQHTINVRGSAIGDRPAFAGGEGAVDSQLGATLTWSGEAGSGNTPGVTLDTAEGVDARDLRSAFTGGAFTAALVDAAIDAAATVWQDGRCLELKVDPPGKAVDPGSETEITVTIEHKAFDEEVDREIEASLAGTEELDPLDTPVKPGEFTYTATSAPEGEGTITFRSVSNRGIAEERTETYTVDLRLLLDVDGTVDYRFSGGSVQGTLTGRGLVVKLIAGDEPEELPGVTVTGDLNVSLQSETPLCSGRGSKRYAVDSAVDASAKVVGEGEARQLAVLIRPAQPSAQFKVRIRCERGGTTLSIPLRILFPHFAEGGELLIPIGGGSAERRGNVEGVRSKFTFTLRREQ